jgi:hypothetical protein
MSAYKFQENISYCSSYTANFDYVTLRCTFAPWARNEHNFSRSGPFTGTCLTSSSSFTVTLSQAPTSRNSLIAVIIGNYRTLSLASMDYLYSFSRYVVFFEISLISLCEDSAD